MCGNYSPTNAVTRSLNAVTRSPRKGSSKKKLIFRRKLHFNLVLDDVFLPVNHEPPFL